jgi:hypothetical protein
VVEDDDGCIIDLPALHMSGIVKGSLRSGVKRRAR